jgi:hypothetical protein
MIWCDSRADGKVRMEEDVLFCLPAGRQAHALNKGLLLCDKKDLGLGL